MTGTVLQEGSIWVWRTPGRADLLLRHNEWGKTPASKDMPRLNAPLARLDALVDIAREALAHDYYDIWRTSWKREGDGNLTREDFMQVLTLMSVSYPSAQHLHTHFDMSFDDAGLFAGHAFFASFTLDGVLHGVEMFG